MSTWSIAPTQADCARCPREVPKCSIQLWLCILFLLCFFNIQRIIKCSNYYQQWLLTINLEKLSTTSVGQPIASDACMRLLGNGQARLKTRMAVTLQSVAIRIFKDYSKHTLYAGNLNRSANDLEDLWYWLDAFVQNHQNHFRDPLMLLRLQLWCKNLKYIHDD